MRAVRALGIYREVLHSPNREFDDYEILRVTGQRLSEAGLEVSLLRPEDVSSISQALADPPDLAFVMCEQEKMLQVLHGWSMEETVVVNSPRAILNTYRFKMVPLLKAAEILFPETALVGTYNFSEIPEPLAGKPLWIKRFDVHNTQAGDVCMARSVGEVQRALAGFRERGIGHVFLQEHVPGDLIKFYGVGNAAEASDDAWFKWFYHKNQELQNYPFDVGALKEITRRTARCLDLEVYGGDAIVTTSGEIFVIDINAWPSFALFREEASKAIAGFLLSKIGREAEKV